VLDLLATQWRAIPSCLSVALEDFGRMSDPGARDLFGPFAVRIYPDSVTSRFLTGVGESPNDAA
jgi:hypothetical protein